MRKRMFTLSLLTALLMLSGFVLSDREVRAAEKASGGVVISDSVTEAEKALGAGNADVSVEGQVLTITLKKDIILSDPLVLTKGESGDRIVLDLAGHSLTGAVGVAGKDEIKACGEAAIEIAAEDFDVEIKGPGKVAGGKGAVYEDASGCREGRRGGDAVFFTRGGEDYDLTTGSDLGYNPEKLEYGLSVTGGAEITGGAGADVTYDDWLNNLSAGDDWMIHAGTGGCGIGQIYSGDEMSVVLAERVFARIIIENGTVTGGRGGGVDVKDHPLNHASLLQIPAIKKEMKTLTGSASYDSLVAGKIRFNPADGGSGIRFYAGRKYVEVGKKGTVTGGMGGSLDFGDKGSMSNRVANGFTLGLLHDLGDGGSGIAVCGDMGLTNEEPAEGSDGSTGIRVYGTVKGGDTPDVTAYTGSALDAGDGIAVYHNNRFEGDYEYQAYSCYDAEGYAGEAPFDSVWGNIVVEAGGLVMGGDGGSVVSGEAGSGGKGISAAENASYSNTIYLACIEVNGEVRGGNGGDSASYDFTTAGEVPTYNCGAGGEAVTAYREGVKLIGRGKITAGDFGQVTYRDDYTKGSYDTVEGVRQDKKGRLLYGGEAVFAEPYYNFNEEDISGSLTLKNGGYARVRANDTKGFSAEVTMTPFGVGQGPNKNTAVACTYKTPSGYKGKVFLRWCVTFCVNGFYDSAGSFANNEFDLEGSGLQYKSFKLLGDSAYPNGKYEIADDLYVYRLECVTTDQMKESTSYNDNTKVSVYCYAMLEDGRIVKSNEVWFTKNTRSKTGWGTVTVEEETASKKANPLKVKAKTATVRYSDLKKGDQTLAVTDIIKFTKKGKGTLSYQLASVKKGSKSFKSYFAVDEETGRVTVKQGLKKGTYKVKLKVQAAGNANYEASAVKTVTGKVVVQ